MNLKLLLHGKTFQLILILSYIYGKLLQTSPFPPKTFDLIESPFAAFPAHRGKAARQRKRTITHFGQSEVPRPPAETTWPVSSSLSLPEVPHAFAAISPDTPYLRQCRMSRTRPRRFPVRRSDSAASRPSQRMPFPKGVAKGTAAAPLPAARRTKQTPPKKRVLRGHRRRTARPPARRSVVNGGLSCPVCVGGQGNIRRTAS